MNHTSSPSIIKYATRLIAHNTTSHQLITHCMPSLNDNNTNMSKHPKNIIKEANVAVTCYMGQSSYLPEQEQQLLTADLVPMSLGRPVSLLTA